MNTPLKALLVVASAIVLNYTLTAQQVNLPSTLWEIQNVDASTFYTLSSRLYLAGSDMHFQAVDIPPDLAEEMATSGVNDHVANANTRSIFFGVTGGEGLYRYDIDNDKWDTVRPLTEVMGVTALACINGRVFIGTGVPNSNIEFYDDGIFYSDDNGDTWTKLSHPSGTDDAWPTVEFIATLDKHSLTVQLDNTDSLSGVFQWNETTGWNRVRSTNIPELVLANSTDAYHINDRKLWYTRVSDTLGGLHRVDSLTRVVSIERWNLDTLLVMCRTNEYTPTDLILVVDTTVVDTIGTKLIGGNANVIDFNGKKSLTTLGHGTNSILDSKLNVISTCTATPICPEVSVYSPNATNCMSHAAVNVYRHGWFLINADGTFVPLTSLGLSDQTITTFNNVVYPDAFVIEQYGHVVSVAPQGIDTLFYNKFLSENFISTEMFCLGENNSAYGSSTSFAKWTKLNTNNESMQPLSKTGWPYYLRDTDTIELSCDATFEYNGRFFAWATGYINYPDDFLAVGGLFVYVNNAWVRADSGRFGRHTVLQELKAQGDQVIIAVRESHAAVHSMNSSIHRWNIARNEWTVAAEFHQTMNQMRAMGIVDTATVAWSTYDGKLWFHKDGKDAWQTLDYPNVLHIGSVGNKLFLVTASNSAYLLSDTTVITSVNDDMNVNNDENANNDVNDGLGSASGIRLYPNPADNVVYCELTSAVETNASVHVKVVDVLGREVTVGSSAQFSIDTSLLPNGLYYVLANTVDGVVTNTFLIAH